MIRDGNGFEHPDILSALQNIQRHYRKYPPIQGLEQHTVGVLLADISAIIASASGAKSAAEACGGDRADLVLTAACGRVG
jgi:hypothetical protein